MSRPTPCELLVNELRVCSSDYTLSVGSAQHRLGVLMTDKLLQETNVT